MSETLIIVLEDVLVQGDRAIPRHIAMFNGLASQFRTVVVTTMEREEAKRLLRLHEVRYDVLLTKDDSILSDEAWKVSAVRECLAVGWHIGLYLDTDPETIRNVFSMGVTSLLLSHHLLRPSWLPGEGPPRAWDDLVAFTDAQRERTAEVHDSRSSGNVRVAQ